MNRFFSDPGYSKAAAPAITIGLVALSFALRLLAFRQTEFANGWDSYFYLVQLQSWNDTGAMHAQEYTLFYPLLWMANLCTPDYVTTVKIFSALLAAGFTAVIFMVCRTLQTPLWTSTLICAYTIFSPELTYFAAQWPKNLLGIILFIPLLPAIWKNKWLWVAVLLALGFFGHRMTAVLGCGVAITYLFLTRIPARIRISLIVILCAGALAGFLIPGILKIRDIDRLDNLLDMIPQLPVITFSRIFGPDKISALWNIEQWVTLAILVAAIIRLSSKGLNEIVRPALITLLGIMLVLWFPFYHWETGSAAYRLFHVGILLTPLFLIFILPTHNKTVSYGAALILLFAAGFSWRAYDPETQDPPYAFYDQVTAKARAETQLNDSLELIIAHKSLAEYYSFTTQSDAMAWRPGPEVSAEHIRRIAVLPYPQLYVFYTKTNPEHLAGTYYLIPETEWQQFIASLATFEPNMLKEHLTWKNPNDVRPAFLTR